jgi:ribonuclease P protein component
MGWVKGLHLWLRCGGDAPGVVFVVRRNLGTAVMRNRLKRRLRRICRDLENLQGSVVIAAQPSAVEASFWELHDDLKKLNSKHVKEFFH